MNALHLIRMYLDSEYTSVAIVTIVGLILHYISTQGDIESLCAKQRKVQMSISAQYFMRFGSYRRRTIPQIEKIRQTLHCLDGVIANLLTVYLPRKTQHMISLFYFYHCLIVSVPRSLTTSLFQMHRLK